jgi:hypothetical protein
MNVCGICLESCHSMLMCLQEHVMLVRALACVTLLAGHVMTGMAVKVAIPEEGRRLAQLLKADSAVSAVHPVVSSKLGSNTAPHDLNQ